MKPIKKLGIWMDHSEAHIIEFSDTVKETGSVQSGFTFDDKGHSFQHNESTAHHKQQEKHRIYYKKLSAIIRDFGKVVLFGPTDAKVELFNFLRKDHLFEKINIEVKSADKMSDAEQHAFVRDYFKKFEFKALL
jgi:hypothetical protein